MEEYNLLIGEGRIPGVFIIKSSSYVRMPTEKPGTHHENLGTFYSDIPCENLAQRVETILDDVSKEKLFDTGDLAGDIVWNLLVEMTRTTKSLKRKIVDPSFQVSDSCLYTDYIIKYQNGVGIHCPRFYQNDIDPAFPNASLALFLLHGLSTDADGSAMRSFDKLVDDIHSSIEMTRRHLSDHLKFCDEARQYSELFSLIFENGYD